MKEELNELLKQIQGQDIAITVGPGGKAMLGDHTKGDATKEKLQQDVQAMKDFMNKSVEQIAAGVEKGTDLQVIDVRMRKLVVTKTPGRQRTDSILVACLYALKVPAVDSIISQAGIQGHFRLADGTVAIQPFIIPENKTSSGVMETPKNWNEKIEEAAPNEDVKRNILVEATPPVETTTLKVGDPVVVKNLKGEPEKMGEVSAVIPEDQRYMVKDMYGNNNSYGKDSLIPIESVADAAQWATRIIHWRTAELKDNNG